MLSRQAERLKKLVDDLLTASKASSGTMDVNIERCESDIIISQVVSEYEERLAGCGLKLVVNCESLPIMADGRLLWRVLDNLMSNVCKYALEGTRVYLSVEKAGDKALITVKNISREQLDVTSDTLLERFVRGDSARSTEGNGLGLSIADSFCRLMNGEMKILCDGDLFRVSVLLPLADGE